MITIPVCTDIHYRAGVNWWDTTHVELGVNPCELSARYRVTDEDGEPLIDIDIEMETEN